jgi:hypothetical protein
LNAALEPFEKLNLVAANGKVIGAPSDPFSTLDGFNLCSGPTSC